MTTKRLSFSTTLQLSGKTATGIRVPAEVVEGLGKGKRPAVQVTLNAYSYRSTVAPLGGAFMLPVSAEVRERAGVAAGDEVAVTLELDTEPREVRVPPELAAALEGDAAAKRAFEGLSYSKQRGLVEPIEQAKTDETRHKRVAKALDVLREGAR